MGNRVYILLDAIDGKADQVAETLLVREGVKMVDLLEERPNVIMMIQAHNRDQLAELTNRALASVESMTDGWQLLPTQNRYNMKLRTKPYQAKSASSEGRRKR